MIATFEFPCLDSGWVGILEYFCKFWFWEGGILFDAFSFGDWTYSHHGFGILLGGVFEYFE